jgi:hypothetical protein
MTPAATASCPCAEALAEAQALLDRLRVVVEHAHEASAETAETDPAPRRPALTLVGGRAS